MKWKWHSGAHPISDVLDWRKDDRLEIRPDFQRREVWSEPAKIMLIDTILSDIPMPKFYISAEIRGNHTYRTVIDGQQRLTAIFQFVDGLFLLNRPYAGPYAARSFKKLPGKAKQKILQYKIDINEIVNASEEVVRKIYSRVNKYTMALTKQELRKADFPGDFLEVSEKLALLPWLEDAKIFTVASRRRMGDVEYVSELLAILLKGIQDKTETLDEFYQDFATWGTKSRRTVENRFEKIIGDLNFIFPNGTIGKTRFHQKADFYSLFAAVATFTKQGHSILGKNVEPLQRDLDLLDKHIAPESGISVLSDYAVKLVSQANSATSRESRRSFLALFLSGTYISSLPAKETIDLFAKILIGISRLEGHLTTDLKCPVCDESVTSTGLGTASTLLTWRKETKEFQLSNAEFIHTKCAGSTGPYFKTEPTIVETILPAQDRES